MLEAGLSRREVAEKTGLTQYQLWRLVNPQVNEDERIKNVRRLARNGWQADEIGRILGFQESFVQTELRRHPVEPDTAEIDSELEDEIARELMEQPS